MPQKFVSKYAPKPYDPSYVDLLIDHMATGHSVKSFGALCNVSGETVYNWIDKYPEFAEAKAIGETKRELWFENELDRMKNVGSRDGNVAPLIFLAKNMTDLREIKTVDGTGQGGAIEVVIKTYEVKDEGEKKNNAVAFNEKRKKGEIDESEEE